MDLFRMQSFTIMPLTDGTHIGYFHFNRAGRNKPDAIADSQSWCHHSQPWILLYATHCTKDTRRAVGQEVFGKHKVMGTPRSFNEVVAGMVSSARGGTCAHAVHPGYTLAGKTGTAQNRGKDHSVFMGFAPVESPKIAIAVYVENGGFGVFTVCQ